MTWLHWLTLVVIIVALAALTGLQPKGGRQVAGTRLMSVARILLILVAVVFVVLTVRAGFGG